MSERATCGGCDASWTGTSPCHCAAPGCHRTFSGIRLFDAHRHHRGEHGGCLDPETVTNARGERVMFFRDGMWRGPEMSDEEKSRASSARAAS